MTLTNKEFLENIYRKASERAESESERDTVWAMADVNDVAEETIELTDELAETMRKIARVSRMKLNLGVNIEIHGKNEILENDGVETQNTAFEIESLKKFVCEALDRLEENVWRLNQAQQDEKPQLDGQEKIKQAIEGVCK
tara:strand:- start:837 stop:1259 length:423 start_codon:yes stop_codon:yes gene_type:complete